MTTNPTLVQVLRDVCQRLHSAQGVRVLGTTDALGSTTTLLDSVRLKFSGADADALGNAIVRIDSAPGGGPTSGAWSQITDGGLAGASGTATVSPPFAAAVQSGTDYSLWWLAHPDDAVDAVKRVLRRQRRDYLIPVSLLADADMEATGTANWSVVSNATLTKITTNVRFGTQALQVDSSGANPTMQSQGYVLTTVGDTIIVAADVRCGTIPFPPDKVVMQPYVRLGNVLPVGDSAYTDAATWQHLRVDVPMNGDAIGPRFSVVTGALVTWVIDNVIVWPQQRGWFTLPAEIEDPADVVDLGYFRRSRALNGKNAYMLDEGEWVPWEMRGRPVLVDEGGGRAFQIYFQTPVTEPLYIRARKPYAEPASDTGTTTFDRELLVNLTLIELYKDLETQARSAKDAEEAANWARLRGDVEQLASVDAFLSRFHDQHIKLRTPMRRRGGGWAG